MADALEQAWEQSSAFSVMPWRRVEDWPGQPDKWWTALAVNAAVVGYAAVWPEAGGWTGWVNPSGPTERATHATEREAVQWCQERLREAAAS